MLTAIVVDSTTALSDMFYGGVKLTQRCVNRLREVRGIDTIATLPADHTAWDWLEPAGWSALVAAALPGKVASATDLILVVSVCFPGITVGNLEQALAIAQAQPELAQVISARQSPQLWIDDGLAKFSAGATGQLVPAFRVLRPAVIAKYPRLGAWKTGFVPLGLISQLDVRQLEHQWILSQLDELGRLP